MRQVLPAQKFVVYPGRPRDVPPNRTSRELSPRAIGSPHRPNPPPPGKPPPLPGRRMNPLTALIRLTQAISERNQLMSQLDDTLTQVNDQLAAISTQLSKGFNEVTAKIEELSNTASTGQTIDPAVLDALHAQVTALAGQAQALDDVVPDQPAEPAP